MTLIILSITTAASTCASRRDSRAPSPSPYRHAACNALSTTVDRTANATECCVMLGMNIIANYHVINFGGGFHLCSSNRLAGYLTIALSTGSLVKAALRRKPRLNPSAIHRQSNDDAIHRQRRRKPSATTRRRGGQHRTFLKFKRSMEKSKTRGCAF